MYRRLAAADALVKNRTLDVWISLAAESEIKRAAQPQEFQVNMVVAKPSLAFLSL